ncbi:ComEC/Rec2 family competence protein [Corynebacterium aquilae]|uniref:ComEC/Rec2 family competence protein n=1 Tax=Corynebacterium aquilae TaxID=203263 RepID=UPI0012EDC2CA|nr:ComEC/Rec2 family competence protein [Corynebacterium aquilae]
MITWCATWALLTTHTWWLPVAIVVVMVLLALSLKQPGQAVVGVSASSAALGVAALRMRQARASRIQPGFRGELSGRLLTAPKTVAEDLSFVQLETPGHPVAVPLLIRDVFAQPVPRGSMVQCQATVSGSQRPGVAQVIASCDSLHVTSPPKGVAAVAEGVRASFARVAQHTAGSTTGSLLQAMVLGDTSGQSPQMRQVYQHTGLSHLSAVSGANVAIVVGAVFFLAGLWRVSMRWRVVWAAVALVGFVLIVGFEPSVLRATISGVLALVGVVAATRQEAIHGLAVAVIVLVIVDSEMAVSYGFALSVAATVGIVALHPLLLKPVARAGVPGPIARAVAVAVGADVATAPLVASMAGQIPVVSVVANLVVAVAVAPITVVGMAAAVCAPVPVVGDVVAGLLLTVIAPCAWWIQRTATALAGLAHPTLPVGDDLGGILIAALMGAWLVALISVGAWRRLGVLVSVGVLYATGVFGVVGLGVDVQPVLENPRVVVVDTVAEAEAIELNEGAGLGGHVDAVVVRHCRQVSKPRPLQRVDGVPVVCPGWRVHVDGTQSFTGGQ